MDKKFFILIDDIVDNDNLLLIDKLGTKFKDVGYQGMCWHTCDDRSINSLHLNNTFKQSSVVVVYSNKNIDYICSVVKKLNPTCTLITFVNDINIKYSIDMMYLVSIALKRRSNLLINYNSGSCGYSVIDPLGNTFIDDSKNIEIVISTILTRIDELLKYHRARSECKGSAAYYSTNNLDNINLFLKIIREYSNIFQDFLVTGNENRYLGNASFRCNEGFPSFRNGNTIYVSARNINKSIMQLKDFVPVELDFKNVVKYFGDKKPSVDSPVQLKLYNYYKNVNYILHSHCYIDGVIMTKNIMPCGVLEEFDEVIKRFPNTKQYNFCLNTKGHGSIILAKDVDYFNNIPYYKREFEILK